MEAEGTVNEGDRVQGNENVEEKKQKIAVDSAEITDQT